MEAGNVALPDGDEQLARTLQESLNARSLPERTLIKCAGCKTEIGQEKFEKFMGDIWHSECIRCRACSQLISKTEAFKDKDRLYHKSCHDRMCHVCFKIISASRHGITPVWNKKYCYSHETDGTHRCCGCGQLEPNDVEYVGLPNDGRDLCLECLEFATMNSVDCQPLYMDVREFFEGLEMEVEQQIPLLLVERDALNEAVEREKNHHHDSLTIGMCLCEAQVIRTVVSKPRTANGRRIRIITEPYQVERHWHVTAILVLYGLPRLFTGSILAHELMHAWLRLNGYKGLEPEVEEGICQVMAHKWLESELLTGSSSSSFSEFERKLAEFHIRLIEKNPSRVYGGGFRAAKAAVNRYGLRHTLEHIKRAGDLP
ncbi:hypothetical protein LUZ61_009784 [Rhynchospora tenuis]|uniref:LIM zinc-binding domain-containing protein n=1 Tax=Rhynchospora tenuis TaxID=198213 RepID=A0AAD5ZY69_9POAL|nr:hypothetical protein LUZ61_009784 [Rhynchospora tenuis]